MDELERPQKSAQAGQEVYQPPKVTDLGTFQELTQTGSGVGTTETLKT